MKTVLILITFTFAHFFNFSLASAAKNSAYVDLVAELDGPYYYGDDGQECSAQISDLKIEIKQPVTNSLIRFKAINDPSLQRHCESGTWNCKVTYDLFDDYIVKDSLECELK